jgi:hypothetical protein
MGMTFSIGGTAFATHSESNGRKALGISVNAAGYDVKRFHPPGTDGNLIIRNGRVGQSIVCAARYIGASIAAARSLYTTDKTAFENTAVSIIDDANVTHTNCNMTSGPESSPPKATGRTAGQVYFDVIWTFTRDS